MGGSGVNRKWATMEKKKKRVHAAKAQKTPLNPPFKFMSKLQYYVSSKRNLRELKKGIKKKGNQKHTFMHGQIENL